MKKITFQFTVTLLAAVLLTLPAIAKKPKKQNIKPGEPNPKITIVVKALMNGFNWGMTKQEVVKKLTKMIRKEYSEKMKKSKLQMDKDKLYKNMQLALKALKKSVIDFKGQNTAWNTSIIDDQFAHNNNESMVVYQKDKETYYFFFYNNRLYKVFITLDKKKFMGMNFAKFQYEMEKKFGPAKEVFKKGLSGMSELHHIMWKSPEGVELWAMDKTTVYGRFVFVIIDSATNAEVEQSRSDNGTKVPGEEGISDEDPVINSIMK